MTYVVGDSVRVDGEDGVCGVVDVMWVKGRGQVELKLSDGRWVWVGVVRSARYRR